MALSGLHVACCFVGSVEKQIREAPVLRKPEWSQTLAIAGTTDATAPGVKDNGDPVFHIISSVDAFVAVGPAPNASTGPRMLVQANTPIAIYVGAGDKLAWVAA